MLIIASQDTIEAYEQTGRKFLREILDLSWDEVLITDESDLSDFSSCGLPDGLGEACSDLMELYDVWDAWVIPRIKECYGLELSTTAIPLVKIFADIEAGLGTRVLH